MADHSHHNHHGSQTTCVNLQQPKIKTTTASREICPQTQGISSKSHIQAKSQQPYRLPLQTPCAKNGSKTRGGRHRRYIYVNFIAAHAVPRAMCLEEIKCATLKDATLQEVARCIRSVQWDERSPTGVDAAALSSLNNIHAELPLLPDNELILRDTRIVIPHALQARTLAIAHEGHQVLVKTKRLLREKVWFPGIDNQAETLLKGCLACQATMPIKNSYPEPLKMSELPAGPWLNVCANFWGPTPNEKYVHVITDEYSRYPVVDIVTATSATVIIPVFDKLFSMFGIHEFVKTDNGPPFNGNNFSQFANFFVFKHCKITPHWPQSNAEVERFMQNIAKTVKAAQVEGKNWSK